jgi:hypothetical protein
MVLDLPLSISSFNMHILSYENSITSTLGTFQIVPAGNCHYQQRQMNRWQAKSSAVALLDHVVG